MVEEMRTNGMDPNLVKRQLEIQAEAVKQLVSDIKFYYGEDEELISDTLEGETDIHEVFAEAAFQYEMTKGMILGLEETIKRMQMRKERMKARNDNLRIALRDALKKVDLQKITTPAGTISQTKPQVKYDITDESEISSDFFKSQDPKLDKAALTKHVKEMFIEANKDKAEDDDLIMPDIAGCDVKMDNGNVTIRVK